MPIFKDAQAAVWTWNTIWSAEQSNKAALDIADTVILENGEAVRWLFTAQDGLVKKKRAATSGIEDIVQALRASSDSVIPPGAGAGAGPGAKKAPVCADGVLHSGVLRAVRHRDLDDLGRSLRDYRALVFRNSARRQFLVEHRYTVTMTNTGKRRDTMENFRLVDDGDILTGVDFRGYLQADKPLVRCRSGDVNNAIEATSKHLIRTLEGRQRCQIRSLLAFFLVGADEDDTNKRTRALLHHVKHVDYETDSGRDLFSTPRTQRSGITTATEKINAHSSDLHGSCVGDFCEYNMVTERTIMGVDENGSSIYKNLRDKLNKQNEGQEEVLREQQQAEQQRQQNARGLVPGMMVIIPQDDEGRPGFDQRQNGDDSDDERRSRLPGGPDSADAVAAGMDQASLREQMQEQQRQADAAAANAAPECNALRRIAYKSIALARGEAAVAARLGTMDKIRNARRLRHWDDTLLHWLCRVGLTQATRHLDPTFTASKSDLMSELGPDTSTALPPVHESHSSSPQSAVGNSGAGDVGEGENRSAVDSAEGTDHNSVGTDTGVGGHATSAAAGEGSPPGRHYGDGDDDTQSEVPSMAAHSVASSSVLRRRRAQGNALHNPSVFGGNRSSGSGLVQNFYREVSVCSTCFQVYATLDATRRERELAQLKEVQNRRKYGDGTDLEQFEQRQHEVQQRKMHEEEVIRRLYNNSNSGDRMRPPRRHRKRGRTKLQPLDASSSSIRGDGQQQYDPLNPKILRSLTPTGDSSGARGFATMPAGRSGLKGHGTSSMSDLVKASSALASTHANGGNSVSDADARQRPAVAAHQGRMYAAVTLGAAPIPVAEEHTNSTAAAMRQHAGTGQQSLLPALSHAQMPAGDATGGDATGNKDVASALFNQFPGLSEDHRTSAFIRNLAGKVQQVRNELIWQRMAEEPSASVGLALPHQKALDDAQRRVERLCAPSKDPGLIDYNANYEQVIRQQADDYHVSLLPSLESKRPDVQPDIQVRVSPLSHNRTPPAENHHDQQQERHLHGTGASHPQLADVDEEADIDQGGPRSRIAQGSEALDRVSAQVRAGAYDGVDLDGPLQDPRLAVQLAALTGQPLPGTEHAALAPLGQQTQGAPRATAGVATGGKPKGGKRRKPKNKIPAAKARPARPPLAKISKPRDYWNRLLHPWQRDLEEHRAMVVAQEQRDVHLRKKKDKQ